MASMKKIVFACFLIGINLLSDHAFSVTYEVSTLGGLMTQPSSSYYHGAYGASFNVGVLKDKLLFEINYMERPKFNSAGFEDQESGQFISIGTKLNQSKSHHLAAMFGYGSMQGYIKELKGERDERAFKLSGPIMSIGYKYQIGSFLFGVVHHTFSGVEEDQLEAKVIWPYNFFMTQLSYRFGES